MKLRENYIRQDSVAKVWDWGQYKDELKYEDKNEHANEVKTYKMSKEELEQYLKTGELPKRILNGEII